jgi:drug/metabolite transporter (DMT)-like permease
MKTKLIGALLLSLAASIWGAMYVVVKVVVEVVPPFELVWMRYIVAVIALGFIGICTKQNWKIAKKYWLLILAIGLIGNTISIVTQEMGTMLSSAQMGAIITSTTPAFMVLFARYILKETMSLKKWLSIILATIGVGIIVGNGQIDISQQLGGLYLLIAALTWALMSVLVKKVPEHYSQIVVTTYTSSLAVILLTPFVLPKLAQLNWQAIFEPTIFGGILYLGIISTACGFLLWNKGLQLMKASSGGLFFFLQPIVGTFLGWLLLGETIGMLFWLGTICIFIGVFIVIRDE